MVKFIDWTKSELVNVDVIDAQHIALVNLLNEIHPKLNKINHLETENYLARLIDELRTHFDTEENLMKQSKFPGFISHKLEHDRFYLKISKFSSELKKTRNIITSDFLNTFKTWLFNHLEINDRKCAKFFCEQGLDLPNN